MNDDLPTDEELNRLQWTTVLYYLHETNPDNGLVRDKTDPATPSSIAANGLALATLPVIVERGVLYRPFAAKSARRRLQFLHDLPQGPEPDAAGCVLDELTFPPPPEETVAWGKRETFLLGKHVLRVRSQKLGAARQCWAPPPTVIPSHIFNSLPRNARDNPVPA